MTDSDKQPTRHDAWMLKTMNNQRIKRFHATKASRNCFVTLHVALTTAAAASGGMLFVSHRAWWVAVLAVALVMWMPVTGILNSSTDGLLELRSRVLDERQLTERNTVHALAHRATLGAMVSALAGFVIADVSRESFDTLATPLAVTGFAVMLLHWLLPLWIAVVRVPDDATAMNATLPDRA